MKTINRYQLDGGVTEFFFQLEHNTFLAANTLIMVYMTNSDSFSAARETRRGRKEGRKICADSRNNLPEEEETMGLIFRPDCFSFQFLPASRGSQRETIKKLEGDLRCTGFFFRLLNSFRKAVVPAVFILLP